MVNDMQWREYVGMTDDQRREGRRHRNCRYTVVPHVVEDSVEECADVSLVLQNVAAPDQVELPVQRHPEVVGRDVGGMVRDDIDRRKILAKKSKSPGTDPTSGSNIEHGFEVVLRQYLCEAKMGIIKLFLERPGRRNQ